RSKRDWSSDVCSSDLLGEAEHLGQQRHDSIRSVGRPLRDFAVKGLDVTVPYVRDLQPAQLRQDDRGDHGPVLSLTAGPLARGMKIGRASCRASRQETA